MLKLLRLQRYVLLVSRPVFCFNQNSLIPNQHILPARFHDDSRGPPKEVKPAFSTTHPKEIQNPMVSSQYEVFREEDAVVILDIEEERQKLTLAAEAELDIEIEESGYSAYEGLNLERGITGVFEIKDLVEVLRRDNAENIFVCKVPKELKYVDYICVVNGRSVRHMKAMAHFVRKMFKLKRTSKDILPKIEGEDSSDWMAMDMGNIALHIFSKKARAEYDLESLWSVGAKYDKESNKPEEPLLEMYERHSMFLSDLSPFERPIETDVPDVRPKNLA